MIYKGKKFYISVQGYWTRDERTSGKRKVVLLHRLIWEEERGEIPKGHHIHHKDGNRLNNDISNLECLNPSAHFSGHRVEESSCGGLSYLREAKLRSLLTQKGRKNHSEGCKKGWHTRKIISKTCQRCKSSFETKAPQRKWCSRSCKFKNWWHKDKK